MSSTAPPTTTTRKRKAPAAGDAVRTTERATDVARAVPEFAPLAQADEAVVEYRTAALDLK